ncbi:MAG TPA: L-fucose:H+ symporter permease [Rhodanobacter sp.]|jgi:FHS family L-fucose permease-like MFS transporter|nr:L-fucose:H+ symporter permease [Rhodanobacter sp.]
MALSTPPTSAAVASSGNATRLALLLVTSLFFLWGLSYGLLDVLNKHFQESLHITRARSGLLQAAYFGAYFLAALPAAALMQRKGYKFGILFGLALFATGALLFIPATAALSFDFFLFALFVIACGAACLETAANPYVTFLGSPQTSERRLNFAQSFNGLASFIGPLIGGAFFFSGTGAGATPQAGFSGVQGTYVVIALVVMALALLIARTPIPYIHEEDIASKEVNARPLVAQRHFLWAVVAQFFYVAAQVGVNAYFINFVTEQVGVTSQTGAFLLSTPMLCFVLGRFAGTALMSRFAAASLLALYATINVVLALLAALGHGWVAVVALIAVSFFMSIMFPTIFALGVKNLGAHTKRGASFLVMSVVGGAIAPYFMGLVADRHGTATAYLIPAACFVVVAWYGKYGSRADDIRSAR